MKTFFKLFALAAFLSACTTPMSNAPAPFSNTFSQERVYPNRTGWSYWFMNTDDPADTLNVKISMVDTGMASHNPHRHNHDELFVQLEGDAILHLNGKEQVLHPGDGMYCPGGSSHNIQRTSPDQAIKYLMITREARGGIPAPFPFWKESYDIADCFVPFQDAKSFWYVNPEHTLNGLSVQSVILKGKRAHKDRADGRQLVYVIMEGAADITVDGAPVHLEAPSACLVPKGSAGTIAAATKTMRYLQVRTQ